MGAYSIVRSKSPLCVLCVWCCEVGADLTGRIGAWIDLQIPAIQSVRWPLGGSHRCRCTTLPPTAPYTCHTDGLRLASL